ncbi:exodeoxyribonuclease V subunit gamma [Ornithinimicrobium sp. F0845]|uniref:exodeoxyribonuclease V subunit gamma n=1 Tax=Ornithinimicrobium sp. F0845 TaxID=2926412 RepID=UPI001FF64D92|nr:exodeoxyribonuclease V subunit gamma [Ornithinimicrobium sp. F0845]MCK0112813.1 exodeoxyribonuclease V subunit gamma [Ornithinimicrobium sp. F0845]
MTLFVHRAVSTDVLADGLAELLSTPLEDPFAQEVVAVPAKGVERWLAQRLSHRLGAGAGRGDGVCAGVRFLNPHSLVSLVLGIERDDPWHPEQVAWPVLQAIDESLQESWASALAIHLGAAGEAEETERGLRRGRRYAVARRLAGLFSSYAVQRPALIADWRAGGAGDGLGAILPDDLAWQPHLWRAVLELVDATPPDVRHQQVVAALRGGGDPAGLELPGRLSLFGHTRIAASEIEVIAALGEHRDVHLWLPQASPAAWDALSGVVAEGPVLRADDPSVDHVNHPLLASLGRDARELQRSLAPTGARDARLGALLPAPGTPGPAPGDSAPGSLLQWLQYDVARDYVPTAAEAAGRVLAVGDDSVQVHACHGRGRQVQVLRDVLSALLQDDPDLEPRDILVMCPDIDAYAPLVHAGFGLGEVVREESGDGHPAHRLRVMLADRAPRHTNPLLALAARLVELAGGRLTASEVLDLARSEPVRRRFGLDDDSLDRIAGWVEDVAVRWGLDAEHRATYDLGRFPQNTWRTGLDRVLTGAALDGRDLTHLGQTVALDDLDSGDIDLAGRLAELVERLGSTLTALHGCRQAGDWSRTLRAGVLGLATTTATDAWQVTQLERELARIEASARRGTSSTELALSDVRALLEEHVTGRATRTSFRTGTLTVCTMVPMRSVPHKVVALVGMDDGIFPRTTTPDGDDALARTPVTGERDTRAEDRQLLLDAVMAARQTLVITYTGADEHSGAERPPAVPLGELLDTLAETAQRPAGAPPLVRRHPLQPYDARNLGATVPGEPALLPGDQPFSFDPAALAGGRAHQARRAEPPAVSEPASEPVSAALLPEPLPPLAARDLALEDLQRFLAQPAQAFLRQRLGLLLPDEPEEPSEGIPIDLDGLERWQIGDRMLRAVLDGTPPERARQHELWRGSVPPGELGRAVLDEISGHVRGIHLASLALHDGPASSIDIDVELPDGRRLIGTVPGLYASARCVVTSTYSSIKAKQRLRSWVTVLALAAAGHEDATSHVVGQLRRGRKPGVGHYTHGPVPQDIALTLLGQLVDLYDRGMTAPLPLGVQTACAFAESFHASGDERSALFDAEKSWKSSTGAFSFTGEQDNPAFVRVLGAGARLADVAGTPAEDERWVKGLSTRFGQLAFRVWQPLIATDVERREWV